MAIQAASSQNAAEQTRQRRRRFNVAEAIEMLQTEGSDVEEMDEDEEDSVSSAESDQPNESDTDYTSEASEGGEGWGRLRHTTEEKGRRAMADMNEDEFLRFLQHDWHEDFSFFPTLPPFSGSPGLHLSAECHAPFDFFNEIVTDDFLNSIVEETNRYARENLEARGELKRRSIFRNWPEDGITVNDLVGFFAICVYMGVIHKPEVKDYWSTKPMLQSPFAPAIMSRDKFHLILAMLHVSNNADYIPPGHEGHDPLQKIRPVYTHLQHKFRALYTPQENICVDEAMCAWRGKSRFRVYMKDKPTKWGIKLYELCESDSGYVYNFEIFAAEPGVSNRPVDVVMRLAEPLLDEGRSVYVDNYYACPELADLLVARDTHCVGTVRANRRGMPPQIKTQRPPQCGQVQAYRQGAAAVLRWIDKKPVHVITTKMDPTLMINVTTRRGDFMKPAAVQDYILNMAGVDKSDQLLSYMPLNRKTLKWWKKLFFHLFTLSLIQASVLYNIYQKSRHQERMSLKTFVIAVGDGLNERYQRGVAATVREQAVVPDPAVPGPSAAPPAQSPQSRLSGKQNDHISCPLPPLASGKKNYRKCHVCTARSKRHPDVKLQQTPN